MIKNISYGLTILLSGAAAYFGATTKGELEQRISETVEMVDNNDIVSGKIEEKEDLVKTTKVKKKEAEDARNLSSASLDNEASKERGLKSSVAELDAEIEEADVEIVKIEGAIATAEALIRDLVPNTTGNLDIDSVVSHIESLENQRKEKETELEEKTLVANSLGKKAEEVVDQKERLQGRLATTRSRIALNPVAATVTGVSNGYGFVVINRGSNNSNISQDSELIVSRGSKFVGRLKVVSVEPNQTVCDIVPSSLKAGQRIHRGDKVDLKQVLPN